MHSNNELQLINLWSYDVLFKCIAIRFAPLVHRLLVHHHIDFSISLSLYYIG